jgi:hypothetical protein
VDGRRLDLTAVPATARLVDHIPFAGPDLGPIVTTLQVTALDPGYPVRLAGESGGEPITVWITARGYDAVLRSGDRIHLSGRLRRPAGEPPEAQRLLTVDDWPGHHLHLESTR